MWIPLQCVLNIWSRGWGREGQIIRKCRNKTSDGVSAPSPSQEKEACSKSVTPFAQASDCSGYRRLSRPSRPIQPAHRLITMSIDPPNDLSDDLLTGTFQTPRGTPHTVIRGITNWL